MLRCCAAVFVNLVVSFGQGIDDLSQCQDNCSDEWATDEALLGFIQKHLPSCLHHETRTDTCCNLRRAPLIGASAIQLEALRSRPVLFTNSSTGWHARTSWAKSKLRRDFGATIVHPSTASEIAKRGPRSSLGGDRGAIKLSALLDTWDSGDRSLIIFQHDQMLSRGHCRSLQCVLRPEIQKDQDTVHDFFVPPVLSDMDNLIFSASPSSLGLPFHVHGAAWSTLVYGLKLWLLYSPEAFPASVRFRSVSDALADADLDRSALHYCLQHPGETLVVPQQWAHATLNIGDAVALGGQASRLL